MKDFLSGALPAVEHLGGAALAGSLPVALVGLAILALARGRSGVARHRLCLVIFAVLFALPVVMSIPQRRDITAPNSVFTLTGAIGSQGGQALAQTGRSRQTAKPTVAEQLSQAYASYESQPQRYTIPDILGAVYLLGFLFIAGRQLVNQGRLARLIAKAKPLPGDQKYPVLLSDGIEIPIALWWKRAMVILPSSSQHWTELRRKASIEHEMAHIDRGDLRSVWLGFFVKLLYWPNPLVSVLASQLRDAAESATDDRVLDSGIVAADYAEMLVQTARERGASFGLPVLAMARSSRLSRRVNAVLGTRRQHGQADLMITCVCGMALAGLAILMGRIQGKTPLPTAFSEDLKRGLTVPAEASNGFVGEDADGRKVALMQLERWTPAGIEVWKPDGTPLPPSQVIPDDWHRHDPNELHLFTRFEDKKGEVDLSGAGVGSGPSGPDEPREIIFMGGYVKSDGDLKIIMSLLGVPTLNVSRRMSVTFGYSAKSSKPVWSVYPNDRARDGGNMDRASLGDLPEDFGAKVKLDYPAYGTPFTLDAHGETIKDGKGGFLHDKILSTKLTYTVLSYGAGAVGVEPVAYRVNTGAVIPHEWNDAHQRGQLYDFSYYWPVSPSEIDHIDVNVHRNFHVAYLNFALRPNEPHLP